MNKKMLLLLFVSLVCHAKPPVTDGKLLNFQPGTYSLEKGNEGQCGAGEFFLRDSDSNVAFGDKHGFDTVAKSEVLPGDAPGDEECIYFTEDKIEVEGKETRLVTVEERKCKEVSKHILTKSAFVHKELVKMDVKQTGADGIFEYSCTWKFKKSLPSKK